MSRNPKKELLGRLGILMFYLLKWKFISTQRNEDWEYKIKQQRVKLIELLGEDNPILKYRLDSKREYAYQYALLGALKESGMNDITFPKLCPFSLDDCLNIQFFPEEEII